MKTSQSFSRNTLRTDAIVSLGVTAVNATPEGFENLRNLSKLLNTRFRYWEILIVGGAEEILQLSPLLNIIPNLRLIKVREATSTYRRRFILASEAIGDVLIITTGSEMAHLDLMVMIERSIDQGGVVVSRRQKGTVLDPLIGALGRASGFNVSTRELQTTAYPRSILDMLAARSDKDLALRFVPRDASFTIIETQLAKTNKLRRRGLRGMPSRLRLIKKLLVSLAPRVLGYLSVLSILVVLMSLAFILYVLYVWAFVDIVQRGWVTTSLLLSGTAAFIGLAVFCLSTGLQLIVDIVSPDIRNEIIDEIGSVDLFGSVITELNVDYDPSGHEAIKAQDFNSSRDK